MSQDSVAQVTCRVEEFAVSHWLICRNFGRQTAHELPISLHAASYAFASPLSAILKNLEERTINSKDRRTRKCVRWMYTSLAISVGRKSWWSSESFQLRSLWRRLFMKYIIYVMIPFWQISRIKKNLLWQIWIQNTYWGPCAASCLSRSRRQFRIVSTWAERQTALDKCGPTDLEFQGWPSCTSCTSCTKNQKTYLLSLVVTCCFQVWVSRVTLVWESCCIISFWNRTCRPKCQLSWSFLELKDAHKSINLTV